MKRLSMLPAALMMFTCLSALAQPVSPEKVYEVMDGEFLGNTNLLAFRTESFGKLGIMDQDGNEVVPTTYCNLKLDNAWGFIEAAGEDRLNGIGVIDSRGEVLIPFEYGEIEVLSDEWIIAIKLKEATKENYDYQALFGGYGSGYYLIEERVFYNMKAGAAVGSIPREGYDNAYAYSGFLTVKDMQGGVTVYDEAFNNIGTTDAIYNGYVFLKNGDQWDVKRAGDGKLLFTTPYGISGLDREDNAFKVSHNNKQGRMDLEGNVLVPPEYDNVMSNAGGYYRARVNREAKMGILDSVGTPVTAFKYDDIPALFARGTSVGPRSLTFVRGYAPVELDGKLGFVNLQGEETIAPSYAKEAVELNGNTLLYADATGKKTLVAADGTVTELPYDKVERIYNSADGRLYQVTNAAGQVGVISWHGEVLIPFGNYAGYGTKSSTDSSLVALKNQSTRMLEVYRLPQPVQ